MATTRTVDVFSEHPTAKVVIKIFYPDDTIAVITDPLEFNQKNGNLWVQTQNGVLWVYNTPFHILDRSY